MTGQLDDIDSYAKRLRVPASWVRDAVTARRIKFSKVGRHVRFSEEDHLANLASFREAAGKGSASTDKQGRPRSVEPTVVQFQPRPPRPRSAA